MKDILEIRWHGRGGQGAVTASKLLAAVIGEKDYHVQAFPEYGAERMGAPVQSFNRISKDKIRLHCQIKNPQFVLVLDQTLLRSIDVTEGMKDGGVIIVNTSKTFEEVKGMLNLDSRDIKVHTINATNISIETMGKPIPNTPIIGALMRLLGFLELELLMERVKKILSKKFDERVVEGNLNAITKAYKELEI